MNKIELGKIKIPNHIIINMFVKNPWFGRKLLRRRFHQKAYIALDDLKKLKIELEKQGLILKYPHVTYNEWKNDFLYCSIAYGARLSDYLNLELYKKSELSRKGFVTSYMQWHDIVPGFNGDYHGENVKVLRDKVLFNKYFGDLIGRKWIYITEKTTIEDLNNFINDETKIVLKPYNGTCEGDGIKILNIDEDCNKHQRKKLLEKCKKENMMLETFLKQTGIIHEMNPFTVNTVRIVTMVISEKAEIVFAALKTGNGDCYVDNVCKGGLKMPIDLQTGIISGPAMDKDNKRYYIHPYSGVQLIGQQIPNWHNVCEVIKEAALRVPEIPFIGWDVAISENNVYIIEGNHGSSIQDFEFPWEDGYYDIFLSYLKKYKNIKLEK